MKLKRLHFAFYTILSIGLITDHALSKETVADINEVTVYATKSQRDIFDVPVSASIVDVDSAGNALSGDIDDLFQFTAGVETNNGARRNGQTVSIRGFDDEAVLTLIDGRRQNYESAHDGRFFIDPTLLKKVEIIRGGASSIYGAGAVGGVVAFETKDAKDLLLKGQNFGATTSIGGRSGSHEFYSNLATYGRIDDFDVVASASYRTDRDIRIGDNHLGDGGDLENENNLASALLKLGKTFNDVHNFKFIYQGSQNKGQEPNNGAGEIDSSNPIVNKENSDSQFSLKYAYDDPSNKLFSSKVHLYNNITEVQETDISGSNLGRIQFREINTLGVAIDNNTEFSIAKNHKHNLAYGFEYYNDRQTGFNSSISNNVRAGVPDAEAHTTGFYLQDDIAFDTKIGKFNLIPAIRHDQFKSNDNLDNSQDEGRFSPKVAFGYKPVQNVNLFGSWSQAFRAPNLTELYPTGQHFPGVSVNRGPFLPPLVIFPNNNFVTNPDLKPEVVETVEIEIGFKFRDLFQSKDKFKIKGSYYTSKGRDFITQEVDIAGGTTRNFNVEEARIQGFEIESQYENNFLIAKLGLSYTEAEDEGTGEYLANNVPLTLVTDLGYKFNQQNIIGWRGRFADKNDKVPDTEDRTDGYSVHDLYYRFLAKNSDNQEFFTLDLGIENIFDKQYQRRFLALREEGRSFVGRITYKF